MSRSPNSHAVQPATPRKLAGDFKVLVQDVEELLKSSAHTFTQHATDAAQQARTKLEKTLAEAKDRLVEAEEAVVDGAKRAAKVTDTYVRDNPWKSVGVAAGIGLVVGLFVNRR